MANSNIAGSGSYIRIVCTDDADPKRNRLLLRTNKMMAVAPGIKVPSHIQLKPGVNILKISDYPDLRNGFYNSGCDEQQCSFSPDISEDEKEEVSDLFYWEASDNCQDIIEIDLRHFDGDALTSMDSMFYYMFNLERIYLAGLDTSNVESMAFAFCGVGRDLESWTTVAPPNQKPDKGFYKEHGILNFNLSGLNVEKVKEFKHLFAYDGGVFNDAAHLPVFNLNFDGWKLKSPDVVEDMFTGIDHLTRMTLSGCDQSTIDALSDEWLDYLAASVIRFQ